MKKLLIIAITIGALMFVSSCKKDNLKVAPELTTVEVTAVTSSSATSGGTFITDNGVEVILKGVCWSENSNPVPVQYARSKASIGDYIYITQPTTHPIRTMDGSGTGNFASEATGLKPGTLYYIRAYATYADPYAVNGTGISYGKQLMFTTN